VLEEHVIALAEKFNSTLHLVRAIPPIEKVGAVVDTSVAAPCPVLLVRVTAANRF
jgi:hypothetical protein